MISIHRNEQFQLLPDTILFDFDNTFYAYDPAHWVAYRAVCDKVCNTFSVSHTSVEQAYEHARQQVKHQLAHTAASHSRLLYMQAMCEYMGLGSQILLALDLEQTYWRTFLSHAVLFEDVKELLDDIRLLGIATAIVTDLTCQIQFRKLVYFGLDVYFDCIVTSEEIGHDKPHPQMYQTAIQKVQSKSERVWMIGDNPLNDIQGSRDAIGAITLQKIHEGVIRGVNSQQADATFTDFCDVRSLLAGIHKRSI